MGLETGTYISDLVATNPAGTDVKSQGDDHIRLLKSTVKATFPNINGPVTVTPAELNLLGGTVGTTGTGALVRGTSPSLGTPQITGAVFLGTVTFPAASIADAALSSNVPLKNGANVFTAAQQFTTLEVGHASDTTLSRVAAGRVAVEGDELARLGSINTFTARQIMGAAGGHFVLDLFNTAADAATGRYVFQISDTGGTFFFRTMTDAGAAVRHLLSAKRTGTEVDYVALHGPANDEVLKTQASGTAPATTGVLIKHSDGNQYDAGLNVMPLLTVNAALTFAREHVGKLVRHNEATARTWTTPASSDTTVPVGALINLLNNGTGAITLSPGSGAALARYDGAGAADTGSHTLAQGGVASLYRADASSWWLWGNGGLT